MTLQAPFPWFGGKSRAADLVWERFGDTPNYVEPFFGSGAVLLGRPHAPKIETVNDLDCYVANAWAGVRGITPARRFKRLLRRDSRYGRPSIQLIILTTCPSQILEVLVSAANPGYFISLDRLVPCAFAIPALRIAVC